jgi:hypothetical protein
MISSERFDAWGENTGRPPGSRRRGTRSAPGVLSAAFLGVLLFTACSADSGLDEGTAGSFQARVSSARQLTAQQNYPAALAELQQLGQDVTAAAEQGLVTQDRRARIEAALSKIKAELDAVMTPDVPRGVPTAPPTEAPVKQGGKGQEKDAEKWAEKQQKEAKKEAEEKQEEDNEDAEREKD